MESLFFLVEHFLCKSHKYGRDAMAILCVLVTERFLPLGCKITNVCIAVGSGSVGMGCDSEVDNYNFL